jgi:hypothetical protein
MAEAILGQDLVEGDRMVIKYSEKDKPSELTFETKKGKAKLKKKAEKKTDTKAKADTKAEDTQESPEAKAEEGAAE